MPNEHFLDLLLLALGLGAFLTPFLPFSPLTIDVLNLRRDTQLAIYRWRQWCWLAGGLAFALLAVRLVLAGDAAAGTLGAWLAATMVILAVLYWTGYVPFVMSPPAASTLLPAYDACRRVGPQAVVLGLELEGASRAYLRDQISRPHFFRDVLDDQPLTLTYCILCNSATAFDSTLDGRVLNLRCVTAYNNNIVFEDEASGNFIQQLDGAVIDGPDRGRRLPMLPVAMTTWGEWVRLHPTTTLYFSPSTALRDRLVDRMLAWMIPISRLAKRTTPWHRVRGTLDLRQPAMSFVLGVEAGGEQCAYPISALVRQPVVNDEIAGEPIVVLYDTGRDIAQVFSRRLDEHTLNFSTGSADAVARDSATGSSWNAAGSAIDGPLAGRRLTAIPHFNKLFWFSWALFKPATRVWSGSSEQARKPIESSPMPGNTIQGFEA